MAKDENKSLMTRMSEGKLPADRKTELPATREPRDPSQKSARSETGGAKGKTPEEVLGERAERQEAQSAVVVEEEPVKKWKIRGEELTLDQIAEKGLMDILATQSEQYSYLNKKHQDLLEGLAGKAVSSETKEEAPVAAPKVTAKQILDHYTPAMMKSAEEGYIEPELPDAYPLLMTSLMYFRDIIETSAADVQQIKTWIASEIRIRNSRDVTTRLNAAIDAVAGEDGKIFEMLRKPDVKLKFIDWLYKEVDPKVAELTQDRIHTYYLAFNGEALLELAKHTDRKEPPVRRPTVRGDGSSAAPGGPDPIEQPKSMMQRMTESRLGPEQ